MQESIGRTKGNYLNQTGRRKVFTRSLQQGEFPKRWKTSRIKPLWKGEGNPKESAKSYRPVALLSAMGRLMEGIIAERMDLYSES